MEQTLLIWNKGKYRSPNQALVTVRAAMENTDRVKEFIAECYKYKESLAPEGSKNLVAKAKTTINKLVQKLLTTINARRRFRECRT